MRGYAREYDAADTLDSVVRVHEVGRLRPGEEDSDADGDEDEDGAGNGDEDDSELDDLELAAMEEVGRNGEGEGRERLFSVDMCPPARDQLPMRYQTFRFLERQSLGSE